MEIKLNTKYKTKIEAQNHKGEGIARINNVVVFIPGGVKEDEVEIEITEVSKNFANAQITKLITPSQYRTSPICPLFDECGGCEIMHFKYQYQLDYKKEMVIETLKRLGGIENVVVDDVVGMDNPYYYRNKVQVPLGMIDGNVVCGFYKKKSHEIVSFEECFIQPLISTDIVKYVRDLASKYGISIYDEKTHTGILRHVMVRSTSQNKYMVVLVTNSKTLPYQKEIVNKINIMFPEVVSIVHNINQDKTNVILGRKFNVVYGKDELIEEMLGLKFRINHQSFLQINLSQTIKMYQKVLDLLKPTQDDIFIDAFCGVGTISLLLAKYAKKVYGIEVVSDAIDNANYNKILNNLDNVEFILGKAEEEILKLNLDNITGIVIDPPRKGCEEIFLEKILTTNIERIVYVSCNVATLARDLKILNKNYKIKSITPFDLFSQTSHVECVVLMSRVEK